MRAVLQMKKICLKRSLIRDIEKSLMNSSSKLLNASVNPADNSTMSQTKDKKQKKKNRNSASRRKRLDSSSSVVWT